MNIKMKEKDNKILKTKITLKNFISKKSQQPFPLNSINIQTINIEKNSNYFTNNKKFFTKEIDYRHNLNNNYIINEDQISYSNYNSNLEPSPINSLNSSYSTYTQKKRNHKRHNKKKYKQNNNNINTLDSINNLSLNSNIINTNNSVSSQRTSTESSYNNDFSDSSDYSFRSRDNKRKNYYKKMMAEENEIDYLSRKEVGLISSEEEENNNSVDNNSIEDNFSSEIERILIEIYNKNISIISSGEYNEINNNKSNYEIEDFEKQIKKYLKKQNFKTNLLVLKCLSNKIKELVGKYREKVFEIDEIKKIYDANKLRRENTINPRVHSNNSVGSNLATNSNSSYDSNNNEDDLFYRNTLLLKIQDEITGKGITNILLRELINIKKTLKISSKEIENIFKYPLSILRNDNGKKIKFSIELMQLEEFCKILLNDELISTLLLQMKLVFSQFKMPEIIQLIEQVQDESTHNNEMTRFDKYINEKLGLNLNENNNTNNNNAGSDFLNELNNQETLYDIIDQQIKDNTFNLNNSENNNNSISNNEKNSILDKSNKNSNKKKGKKKKKEKEIDTNSEIDNNKCNFEDIDELVNYINETESKKRKKNRKNKKNKKQNLNNNKSEKEDFKNINNNINENNQCNNEVKDDLENENVNDEFDKEFKKFKEDILKDTIEIYDINKINVYLSEGFLEKLKILNSQ